ncbi:MAG: hypothetical protein ACLFQV_08460 [Vulcanimicrobiota bacterium]
MTNSSINISKLLKVYRAFIERIFFSNSKFFLVVSYRKDRAFCCFDSDWKLIYRIEESQLKNQGFLDYKCCVLNSLDELIIASQTHDSPVIFFKIDEYGNFHQLGELKNFPLIQSLTVDSVNNFYIHSPEMDSPICKYSSGFLHLKDIGEYEKLRKTVTQKIGILTSDQNNVYFVHENQPRHLEVYSQQGEFINKKEVNPGFQYLDITVFEKNLFLLAMEPDFKSRFVEKTSLEGPENQIFRMKDYTQSITVDNSKSLIGSHTRFSIWYMLSSLNIYGAQTRIYRQKTG